MNSIFSKKIIPFLISTLFLIPSSIFAAETLKVDPDHTYILFKINHLNIGNSYGRFNSASGTVRFDPEKPEQNSMDISVQATKIDTNNNKRDKHLRSDEFFDAKSYPLISFKSDQFKPLADNQYQVTGKLTLHGKSRPLTVILNQTGNGKDPWGNYRRGFETTFKIKRSEFGMDFMIPGMGDEILVIVSIEAIRK